MLNGSLRSIDLPDFFGDLALDGAGSRNNSARPRRSPALIASSPIRKPASADERPVLPRPPCRPIGRARRVRNVVPVGIEADGTAAELGLRPRRYGRSGIRPRHVRRPSDLTAELPRRLAHPTRFERVTFAFGVKPPSFCLVIIVEKLIKLRRSSRLRWRYDGSEAGLQPIQPA